MSLSIRAVSKAVHVDCDGHGADETECCTHDEALEFPLGREGLKAGCYVPKRGGKSFSFEVAYSEYALWMKELFQMVYGLDPDAAYVKFRRHRGKPFIELLDMPSTSDGQAIGPKTAAKLHADFVASASKARKYFLRNREMPWVWDMYRDFRKVFKIASDSGFVSYW